MIGLPASEGVDRRWPNAHSKNSRSIKYSAIAPKGSVSLTNTVAHVKGIFRGVLITGSVY